MEMSGVLMEINAFNKPLLKYVLLKSILSDKLNRLIQSLSYKILI